MAQRFGVGIAVRVASSLRWTWRVTMSSLNRFTRRNAMAILGGGVVVACSENPSTGRSQLVLIDDATLAGLGAAAWRDALSKMPQAKAPAQQRRLEQIGSAVVAASRRADLNWEFAVFDSPELNAFVLPGGKVGFYRGLMDFAQSDGEIAAVIGHEIGHVEAHHAAERMSQQLLLQMGVRVAAAVLSEEYGQNAEAIAGALGMGVMYGVVLPYSRAHELEADTLGVKLMRNASFDPSDAVTFWERMVAANGRNPSALELLSTHPADKRRLEALRAAAAS